MVATLLRLVFDVLCGCFGVCLTLWLWLVVLLEDVGVEHVGWFELCACLGAVLQVAYAALVGFGFGLWWCGPGLILRFDCVLGCGGWRWFWY